MPDVMVAGDDPVIDRFAVKGRRGLGGGGKEGVRIGEVFRAQWVEADGRLLSFGSCDRIHWILPRPRGTVARTPPGHDGKGVSGGVQLVENNILYHNSRREWCRSSQSRIGRRLKTGNRSP